MELIYLWIDSYKNIRQKGFNFSSEYSINYEGNKLLTIEKIQHFQLNIFNPSFLNITVLIGENGSGKTSLLEFIEYFFIPAPDRFMHYNCLLIIKNPEGKIIVYNNDSNSKGGLEIISGEIPNEEKLVTNWQGFNEIQEYVKPIYFSGGIEIENRPRYSNRYRSNYLEVTGNELLKKVIIQTNKELLNNFKSVTENYEKSDKGKKATKQFDNDIQYLTEWSSPYYNYAKNELQTKIDFICKHDFNDYDFVPPLMGIFFNIDFFYENQDSFPLLEDYGLLKDFDIALLKREINHLMSDESSIVYLKEGIIVSVFLFLLYYSKTNTFKEFDTESLLKRVAVEKEFSDKIKVIYKELITVNLEYSAGWYFDKDALQDFLKNLDSLIENLTIVGDYGRMLRIKIDDALRNLFSRLFNFWNIREFIFSFDWMQMSAGQNALLTLFSRLYLLGKSQNINPEDTIWLFLDEGELYLHPEWQRRFFNDVHNYLPMFYSNNKIQLIISTHSPYIASNLPKDNIILLKRAKNTTCEIVDMSAIPETFGANIHELLAHSFFMENGTIGEFAKEKIDSLFKFLNSKEIENKYWNLNTAWELIKIIGDKIVKQYLIELFNKKIVQIASNENSVKYIDDLIELLEQERKKLNGGGK